MSPPSANSVQTKTTRYDDRPKTTLAIIIACMFMVGLDTTVVNIALPQIHDGLGFTTTGLAWVSTAYTLAFGGLLLLGGRAGDVLGRRRLFFAGIALFTFASLMGGLAQTSEWLLAARVAQGIAAAFTAPSAYALIATNFAEGPLRNKALGAVAASYAASMSIGLIIGGALTQFVSWRWVLLINVPIGIAVLFLTPLFIRESERHPAKFDVVGALISTVGMSALVYGFLHAASDGWGNTTTLGSFAVGVVLLVAYIAVETRVEQPITPLHLFKDWKRSGAYINLFMLAAPMIAMNFFVVQILQDYLGFSVIEAGLGFLPMAVALVASAQYGAKLISRWGHKTVIVTGTAIVTVGMFWLAIGLRGDSFSYVPDVVGPTFLFGLGAGAAVTAFNVLILSTAPMRDVGAASSLLEAMQWVGGTLGLAVMVTIFGTFSRRAVETAPTGLDPSEHARYVAFHGMSGAFILGGIVVGIAFLLALFGMRNPPAPDAGETPAVGAEVAEAEA